MVSIEFTVALSSPRPWRCFFLGQVPDIKRRSSPRPWRCFSIVCDLIDPKTVFSTSVEVFPSCAFCSGVLVGLLHVRGGVSRRIAHHEHLTGSSPRPWRCFPRIKNDRRLIRSLLHVRGGVSWWRKYADGWIDSSPRPWRCFCVLRTRSRRVRVFSTSVEVFPSKT